MSAITSVLVKVTPAIAKEWLDKSNNKNRPLDKRRVKFYTESMRLGKWAATGEPLIFGTDGGLLNGQHRLSAVVASGESIDFMVTFGVEPTAFRNADRPKPRSFSDHLAVEGVSDHHTLSSAVALLQKMENNFSESSALARYDDLDEILAHHPGLSSTPSRTGAGLIPSSCCRVLWYITHRAEPNIAPEFWRLFISGAGLDNGSPILALRNKILTIKAKRGRFEQKTIFAMFSRAWNAYYTGSKMAKIYISGRDTESQVSVPRFLGYDPRDAFDNKETV